MPTGRNTLSLVSSPNPHTVIFSSSPGDSIEGQASSAVLTMRREEWVMIGMPKKIDLAVHADVIPPHFLKSSE